MQLILASSSPARRALLARLQLSFEIVSPAIDESPLSNESTAAMVERLAQRKAHAVASQYPGAWVIGADTVGMLHKEILQKPVTHDKAVKQLQAVSGKKVRFYTGICLSNLAKQSSQLAVETYDVYFRDLSLDVIEDYLSREDVLQCAGSFHAEGLGITLIEKFAGNDFTTLIGLPLISLSSMLRQVNILK